MKRPVAGLLVLWICLMMGQDGVMAASPYPLYLPLISRASPLAVWTSSPAAKIQPTTRPSGETALAFEGARGATESYQVIVTASAALSGVNVSAFADQ